jgi:hypothetical protein
MVRITTPYAFIPLMLSLLAANSGVGEPAAQDRGATVAREELEGVETLRLAHRYAIQDLHDSRALTLYLKGWGGPDRFREVEDLFIEAEGLYGTLRSVDHGATALQVLADTVEADPASPEQADLVRRARRDAARRVSHFQHRSRLLKELLAEAIRSQAATQLAWSIESRPEPWPDKDREAGRQAGLRFGWALNDRFFALPPAEQDYLLGKAAAMGIQTVDIDLPRVSNWGDIEKEPGRLEFADVDAVLEPFSRRGFRVALMLRSLTGSPPAWHVAQTGNSSRFSLPPSAKDKAPAFGGINVFDEPTAKAYRAFLAKYAAHLKKRWAPTIDAVYAEGGQHELEALPDTSPAMEAYWKRWSRSKTPWRSPETLLVELPVDAQALAQAGQCREQWLLDYVSTVTAGLKAGWPEVTVQLPTAADDFHRLFAGQTGRSRRLRDLTRLTPHPATSTDSSAGYGLLASFGEGRWLWNMALHSGCGTCAGAAIAQAPFYDSIRITTGNYGNALRAYFPQSWFRYCDFQFGDAGIGSFRLTQQRAREMAPEVLNTRAAPADVAILWSQTSLRRDPGHRLFRDAMAWGHLLKRIYVPFDYIAEEDLADRLGRYRLLILPNTQSMPDAAGQAIREWVRGGGALLGFGAPGLLDEHGRRRASLLLADVFGADVARLRIPGPIRPDKLETTHPEGSYQLDLPPRAYKFETNMMASLRPGDATPRAWFAGAENEVAITEFQFGSGQSLLCGSSLGLEYWESAPYELGFGISHARHLNYNMEQKRYEKWVLAELDKRGLRRPVTVPSGRFLRAQRGDDPDWLHIYRAGPSYQQYMFEEDKPARTILTFVRTREGIDNTYIGLVNTEANFMWERAYFCSTLGGAQITVAVTVPPGAGVTNAPRPVVYDTRLNVPVPSRPVKPGGLQFETWLPAAQAGLFAVAPTGGVRRFGPATQAGEERGAIAKRVETLGAGAGLATNECLNPVAIQAFLESRRGTRILIAAGTPRFQPAAAALADWLSQGYGIQTELTFVAPRVSCRYDYMDGFGWPAYGNDPVQADILIGNTRDNGLMWKFLRCHNLCGWLPLEINQDFPEPARSLVMLSCPVQTEANGKPGGKKAASQLVLGAGDGTAALAAVEDLKRAVGGIKP